MFTVVNSISPFHKSYGLTYSKLNFSYEHWWNCNCSEHHNDWGFLSGCQMPACHWHQLNRWRGPHLLLGTAQAEANLCSGCSSQGYTPEALCWWEQTCFMHMLHWCSPQKRPTINGQEQVFRTRNICAFLFLCWHLLHGCLKLNTQGFSVLYLRKNLKMLLCTYSQLLFASRPLAAHDDRWIFISLRGLAV